jgi:hypothetical protein
MAAFVSEVPVPDPEARWRLSLDITAVQEKAPIHGPLMVNL